MHGAHDGVGPGREALLPSGLKGSGPAWLVAAASSKPAARGRQRLLTAKNARCCNQNFANLALELRSKLFTVSHARDLSLLQPPGGRALYRRSWAPSPHTTLHFCARRVRRRRRAPPARLRRQAPGSLGSQAARPQAERRWARALEVPRGIIFPHVGTTLPGWADSTGRRA